MTICPSLAVKALLIPLQVEVHPVVANMRMVALFGWHELVSLAALCDDRLTCRARPARVRQAAIHTLQLFTLLNPQHGLLVL